MPWFQATPSASVGGVFDYKAKGENLVESVGCRLSWIRNELVPPSASVGGGFACLGYGLQGEIITNGLRSLPRPKSLTHQNLRH